MAWSGREGRLYALLPTITIREFQRNKGPDRLAKTAGAGSFGSTAMRLWHHEGALFEGLPQTDQKAGAAV